MLTDTASDSKKKIHVFITFNAFLYPLQLVITLWHVTRNGHISITFSVFKTMLIFAKFLV